MIPLYLLGQVVAVLIGLVIGSFWNVAIARWPDERSVVVPRSHCPVCGTPIAWYDNIPLLSWVLLRGACRHCGASIAVTYPLVEALGGMLAWLLFVRLVPDAGSLDVAHLTAWSVYFVLFGAVVVATYCDIRHRIIPDEVSLWAVPVGVALAVMVDATGFVGFPAPGWRGAILGAAVGGGFLGAIWAAANFLYRADALGLGDVKLVAMLGTFVGPVGVLVVLLVGSMLGSVATFAAMAVLRRRIHPPRAPALGAAAVGYVLSGAEIVPLFLPGLARGLPG